MHLLAKRASQVNLVLLPVHLLVTIALVANTVIVTKLPVVYRVPVDNTVHPSLLVVNCVHLDITAEPLLLAVSNAQKVFTVTPVPVPVAVNAILANTVTNLLLSVAKYVRKEP